MQYEYKRWPLVFSWLLVFAVQMTRTIIGLAVPNLGDDKDDHRFPYLPDPLYIADSWWRSVWKRPSGSWWQTELIHVLVVWFLSRKVLNSWREVCGLPPHQTLAECKYHPPASHCQYTSTPIVKKPSYTGWDLLLLVMSKTGCYITWLTGSCSSTNMTTKLGCPPTHQEDRC